MSMKPSMATLPKNLGMIFWESSLAESRQLPKRKEEISGLGYWEVDLIDLTNQSSGIFFDLSELDHSSISTFTLGISIIHPEDRQEALDVYQLAIKKDNAFHLEKRIIRPSGSVIRITSDRTGKFEEEGQSIGLSGFYKEFLMDNKTEFSPTESSLEHSILNKTKLLETKSPRLGFPKRKKITGLSTGKISVQFVYGKGSKFHFRRRKHA
jgi:hypothetical protein